jgi:hypothetical protein
MQRFQSPEQAPRFLESFSAICNRFHPRRHCLSAGRYRQIMRGAIPIVADAVRLAPAV